MEREREQQSLVRMKNIKKHFGRVVALNEIDFDLTEGEIHGLIGDNGSGKSTLIKTLVGVHQVDKGEVYIRGESVNIQDPKDARKHGIATVYQDLALVDELTVAGNLFLGRPLQRKIGPLQINNWDKMNERASEILESRLDIHIDSTQRVEFLSGGERQAIAIARALVTDPDIVIMDEPTSALSAEAVPQVNNLIKQLRDEGVSVLLISHNIDEIFDLTDRITVLRSGDKIGTATTENVTTDEVLRMMIEGTAKHVATATA